MSMGAKKLDEVKPVQGRSTIFLVFTLLVAISFNISFLLKNASGLDDPNYGWESLTSKDWEMKFTPCERPEYWRKLAEDTNLPRAERRKNVFLLFQRHVKVGMTLSELAMVLGKPKWLLEKDIYLYSSLGGSLPVKFNFDDSVFRLRVLFDEGDINRGDHFEIYLRCSGLFSKEDFYKAILGERIPQWDPKILEMAFVGKGLKAILKEPSKIKK